MSAIARESLLDRNEWNSDENYPNIRGFSVPTIKHFRKENELPSKFSQSDVYEKVRAAAKDVKSFTTITSIPFYY